MNNQDPIADMLTRIRNANRVGRRMVLIPKSKICLGIAQVLRDDPDPAVALAGRLLAHSHEVIRSDPRVGHGGLVGDAGAACSVASPGLLTTRRWPVHVALAPGLTRGQTVVDRRYVLGEDAVHGVDSLGHLVDVAVDVDAEAVRDLFLTTICAGPQASHGDDTARAVQR